MLGKLVKPDPWLGKDMVFLHVAELLEKQTETPSALNKTDKERLALVHVVFCGVVRWRRFMEHNEISPSLSLDAEAAQLFSEIPSISPISDERHAQRIQDATSGITVLINGGRPVPENLRHAAALCDEIGAYLTSRQTPMLDDDE